MTPHPTKRSHTSLQNIFALTAVFAVGFGLVSCVDVTPPGYVQKQWDAQMRELAIIPVFPPREDVQVGDVYLLPTSPEKLDAEAKHSGYLPLGVWACQFNLNSTIHSFYKDRSSFPLTPTNLPTQINDLTNDPYGLVDQATSSGGNSIYTGNGDVTRLRLVGFPQFMSASFTEGDLSALIPIEAVSVAIGGTFTDERKVTVSIPVAESYGLPAIEIQPFLGGNQSPNVVPSSKARWSDIYTLSSASMRFTDKKGTKPGHSYIYGYAIDEVYYTRAIDISITSERGWAGAANVSVTGTQQVKSVVQAATNAAGTKSSVTTTTTTTNSISDSTMNDPIAKANALNQKNAANMSNQLTPGGSLNFVSVSDGAVSMRRAYVRPVAIGFRALEFRLYDDGTVVQQGAYTAANAATLY
jgi:hypothetical protein